MKARQGELQVDGRPVSWIREGTVKNRPMVLLAHGAGAPYTSAFMAATAAGLVRRDLAVTRFHFPYMERQVREGKRRPPDPKPRLLETWRMMLALARRWRGVGPMVLAGKSMGGRIASLLLAAGEAPQARGVVYLGYPLHPPGKPDRLRDAHLPQIKVPQLFINGTKDTLCRPDLLRGVLGRLGTAAEWYAIEGGDHSLALRRSRPLDGSDGWLDAMAAFVRRVCGA